MGVELGLEHSNLGLIQLPLVVYQLLLVALQGGHHAIKPLGQLGQLIVPLRRNTDVQVILHHLTDAPVKAVDGPEQLPAQLQAH